jgi:2-furoyl-CoA dehydrogenase FAD binding subunit
VKPAPFEYIRVDTLDEALSVLAESDLEAKILAGGQSLLPLLNMRLARPGALVDIHRLGDLETLEAHENGDALLLGVGALVRQRTLERYAAAQPRARLLHEALLHIGHPQTRNAGTVGGSLAHADPSAELPLLFITLGGTAFLRSVRGERQVNAEEFFQSYFTTDIAPDELLTKTLWRLPSGRTGIAFKEFRRRHGDFALVAAACTMDLDSEHRIERLRLGICGVAETPLLVQDAQQLVGERWNEVRAQALAEHVAAQFALTDDVQASAAYRRQLATVAISQVLAAAFADAKPKEGVNRAAHQG